MFSKFDLRPWLPALLVILCLANIGFLLFITIVFYPIYIHSDAAAAPLLERKSSGPDNCSPMAGTS